MPLGKRSIRHHLDVPDELAASPLLKNRDGQHELVVTGSNVIALLPRAIVEGDIVEEDKTVNSIDHREVANPR